MARDARNIERDANIDRGTGRTVDAGIDRGTDPGIDPNIGRDIGISDQQDGTLRGQDSLRDIEQERAKVYPAPLAGVEPLEGHPMDPDGEERAIEDAELKARNLEEGDGEPTQELTMTAASLGGNPGVGLLREVRGADGETLDMPGSWRPSGDAVGMPQDLAVGRTLRFEGALHRADGTVQHVVSDVNVTSIGDYDTEAGGRYRIVNFEVSEPSMLGHAAPDDGALPTG